MRPGDDPDQRQQVEEQHSAASERQPPGAPTSPAPSRPRPAPDRAPQPVERRERRRKHQRQRQQRERPARDQAARQSHVGVRAVLRGSRPRRRGQRSTTGRSRRSPRGSSAERSSTPGRRPRAAAARPPTTGRRRRCPARSAPPARRGRWAAPAARAPRTGPPAAASTPVWSRERLLGGAHELGRGRSADPSEVSSSEGWRGVAEPGCQSTIAPSIRSRCGKCAANSRAPSAPALPPSVETNTSVFVCRGGPELVDQLEQRRGRGRARGRTRAARRVAGREHDDASRGLARAGSGSRCGAGRPCRRSCR